MIWPFRPHPPLPLAHKVACEKRFAAVARWLGRGRIPPVTPVTPQDIDVIAGQGEIDQLPERLFAFFRSRMAIPDCQVTVRWAESDELTDQGQTHNYLLTGDGERPTELLIHRMLIEFPYRLAAVTATAVGDCLLAANHVPTPLPAGANELLPLFFGFGPIMANAGIHEASDNQPLVESWEVSRLGMITPLQFGYSMALADWSLETEYEQTALYLRLDAKEGLQNGLRFLRKTADCSFPQDVLSWSPDRSTAALKSKLADRSSSVQLGTLMDICGDPPADPALVESLGHLLRHRESEIQHSAAVALGQCESLPRDVHDELEMLAGGTSGGVRRAVIAALRPGYESDDTVVQTLSEILRRCDKSTAARCIRTLLKYDSYPDTLTDSLLKALALMAPASEPEDVLPGLELLDRLHDDPAELLRRRFRDDLTVLAILDDLGYAFSGYTSDVSPS
ncbi:MAG: hypothetical protein RIK87_27655 [Fuerstiella sp.]